jgi:hypothetical protein
MFDGYERELFIVPFLFFSGGTYYSYFDHLKILLIKSSFLYTFVLFFYPMPRHRGKE